MSWYGSFSLFFLGGGGGEEGGDFKAVNYR